MGEGRTLVTESAASLQSPRVIRLWRKSSARVVSLTAMCTSLNDFLKIPSRAAFNTGEGARAPSSFSPGHKHPQRGRGH